MAAVKTPAEARALPFIRILHRAGCDGKEGEKDVEEATNALKILRVWSRRGRACDITRQAKRVKSEEDGKKGADAHLSPRRARR